MPVFDTVAAKPLLFYYYYYSYRIVHCFFFLFSLFCLHDMHLMCAVCFLNIPRSIYAIRNSTWMLDHWNQTRACVCDTEPRIIALFTLFSTRTSSCQKDTTMSSTYHNNLDKQISMWKRINLWAKPILYHMCTHNSQSFFLSLYFALLGVCFEQDGFGTIRPMFKASRFYVSIPIAI